jgi:hypothetical protein
MLLARLLVVGFIASRARVADLRNRDSSRDLNLPAQKDTSARDRHLFGRTPTRIALLGESIEFFSLALRSWPGKEVLKESGRQSEKARHCVIASGYRTLVRACFDSCFATSSLRSFSM